ncbi:MAG TPA: hypothetical protein VJ904_14785, partial [Tichowtungia sp.]|nr:hypothetical protein [Tichowtungia sp.]
MKKRTGIYLKTLWLAVAVATAAPAGAETVSIYYHLDTPQYEFAAGDVKAALEALGFKVEVHGVGTLSEREQGRKVVIASASETAVLEQLNKAGGDPLPGLGEQAYALRTTTVPQLSYWVVGGDANGAMYGGLQLAEHIRFNGGSNTYNEAEAPHLKNRGVKFNIPLDKKAPTYFYGSKGTSHKEAIRHVWDMDFWTTWFDEMARHRYNVLSLWSPHPFTSMINMEDEYPGIAIRGVTGFDAEGRPVKINDMTIDEKTAFWQKVMEYGRDRGFSVYILTWNIFLSTAKGMHDLSCDPEDPETRLYLRKCV